MSCAVFLGVAVLDVEDEDEDEEEGESESESLSQFCFSTGRFFSCMAGMVASLRALRVG